MNKLYTFLKKQEEVKIEKRYCPECDDWYKSPADVQSIILFGTCTYCFENVKELIKPVKI